MRFALYLLYHLDALLFAELETHFFQFEFLNLARTGKWELVDEEDVLGNLVAGNLAAAEQLHIFGSHLGTFLENDEGTNRLAVFL